MFLKLTQYKPLCRLIYLSARIQLWIPKQQSFGPEKVHFKDESEERKVSVKEEDEEKEAKPSSLMKC